MIWITNDRFQQFRVRRITKGGEGFLTVEKRAPVALLRMKVSRRSPSAEFVKPHQTGAAYKSLNTVADINTN